MIDTEIQYQAFKMREQGYSYRRINKELGISKGTLNYWFSKDGKEKQKKRTKQYRQKPESRFRRKVQRAGFDIKGMSTQDLIEHTSKKAFCYICGDKLDILHDTYDLDHIYPKSQGINNNLSNMHPTHANCNYMKGKMLFTDFLKRAKKILNYQRKQINITDKILAQQENEQE